MTFPVGIYKAMRSVTEGIHRISLANNELKSLTGRFINTFSQLRGKGQPQPLPNAWDTSKTPRLLQRDRSTGEFPHCSFCFTADTPHSKPPRPQSIFLYALQKGGTGFALTCPPKLTPRHLQPFSTAPSKDGAGDETRQKKQLGHNGAWQRWGISGCRRHAELCCWLISRPILQHPL